MAKRKKNKVRNLNLEKKSKSYITLEEDSLEIFERALEETNWRQVREMKEKKESSPEAKNSQKTKAFKQVIDLHGYTLSQAFEAIDTLIHEAIIGPSDTLHLKVITGKGKNSPEGRFVLAREVPEYIEQKWKERIIFLEESPANLKIQGFLLRGHFSLIIKTHKNGES